MWNGVLIACLVACSTLVAPESALADPVGTGTISVMNMPTFDGTVTYDNASYSPFSVPINLGTSVGTATVTGTVSWDPGGIETGTFTMHSESTPAGSLSYDQAGDYICAASGCGSGTPISYVSTLSNITGSAFGGMPADLVYTFDGTVSYDAGVYSGVFGINAFQPASVATGTGVTSSVTTSFFSSGTTQQVTVQVDVTADVAAAGSLTVTAYSNAAGTVPSNFALSADGYNAFFFDVTTTATLTPPITVCQHYADADDDGLVDGTTLDETQLAMLHREGGTFADVTTSRNATDNVICGQSAGLSPFVVAVAVPVTSASLDHFTCYKAGATSGSVKFPGIPDPPGVSLVDQFTDQSWPQIVEVKKPQFLCAPTNKNGEDPTAPTHSEHLKGYQIKPSSMLNLGAVTLPKTNITVTDQFGGLRVDAKKQSHLLVPTVKSLSVPPPLPGSFTVDHFECYKVSVSKDAEKFVARSGVTLQDQFGPMRVDVKKPRYLCNPVDKNGEDPTAPTHPGHLMCYQVKQVKGDPKFGKVVGAYVNNQFGPEQLDVKKPSELCVPALLN